jgi:hypothetical protein
MKTMSRRASILAATLSVVAASSLLVSPAHANDQTDVYGTVPRDGSLVQYATYRTTTSDSVYIEVYVKQFSPTLRMGLRDRNNNQFTSTIVWENPGGRGWAGLHSGIRFAINARAGSTISSSQGNGWSGILYF